MLARNFLLSSVLVLAVPNTRTPDRSVGPPHTFRRMSAQSCSNKAVGSRFFNLRCASISARLVTSKNLYSKPALVFVPVLGRTERRLREALNVKGYSHLRPLPGSGTQESWRSSNSLNTSSAMILALSSSTEWACSRARVKSSCEAFPSSARSAFTSTQSANPTKPSSASGDGTLSKLVTAGFFFFCFTFVSCVFGRHGFNQVICEVLDVLRIFGHVQHFGRVVAGRQRSKGLLKCLLGLLQRLTEKALVTLTDVRRHTWRQPLAQSFYSCVRQKQCIEGLKVWILRTDKRWRIGAVAAV